MDISTGRKKPPNPREKANPVSVATFFFTLSTFIKGFKKELEVTDLYETYTGHKSAELGDRLEASWKQEEINAAKSKRQPSLRRALIKTFGFEFMFYGLFLAFTEFVIRVTQPLLLGQLIAYYMPNQNKISETEAYLYAGGIVLCSFLAVLFTHPYVMGFFHLGMKMRVASCSLIYRKALKLSKTALGETTIGQIVNLLSNDVNRFDLAIIHTHMLWIGPLETVLITYFMYQEVGISAVFGVIFLLLFIPLQIGLGKKAAGFRLRTALRTDERVRLMNEIIVGIQVIKMYTWEKPMAKLIAFCRRYEIKAIKAVSYIRGTFYSFIIFTTRISLFVTILSYVLFDETIDAQQVFVLTAFYNVLRNSMTMFFPQAIAQLAEVNVSVTRLNKFMLYGEIQQISELIDGEKKELGAKIKEVDNKNDPIVIENATAKWTDTVNENTLSNLNLKVKRGNLIAVVGPVGSGKTSLLHVILKELPLIQGALRVNGKISYASQEPWLFTGSVQQNILFGNEMEKLRYRTVVNKCALERDFTLFPYRDKTIVGERGVSLSGGQRARINLARAVYKDADIYLLDDPLSAVDTHVGKQLFEDCIVDYLANKTVILVTHQLQYLMNVDKIIILENGQVKASGTYNELKDSGLDFARLLSHESEKQEKEKTEDLSISKVISRATSVTSAVSVSESDIDAPAVVEEQRSTGTVSGFVYKAYITAAANCCGAFGVALLFVLTQVAASLGDYFITYWVNLEQEREIEQKFIPHFSQETFTFSERNANYTEIMARSEDSFWDFSTETCIYIYSGITIATVIVTFIRSFTFFTVCMRASVRLHDNMFNNIICATMRFFNTNSSGRILNRFSKDMGAVDELLPAAMLDCGQIGLFLIGIVVVVASVNPWLLLPTLVIAVIFYLLRIFYLNTSRNIKRLEGVTRSPVFSHLNASIQGLTTIRAFGAQEVLEKEFDNHQDLHSSAWFLFISTSRAFGYWLDLICVIYIAVVTLSFLLIGNETLGGNVGLAITQSLGLTGMFQWGMRQSAEMENQMTSVERIMEYTAIEKEPPFDSLPDKAPPKTWPERGEIQFVELFLRYFPDDLPVLKNLNFIIKPLEKVGIVGRTGAGKSSLITALFRLTETEGSILIDNVDTKSIGLHDLRSKISIIPQEPVLFSGTMRKNLDPFDEYPDDVLWKALEEVELKEAIDDLAGGLNSKMSEGGSNFSVGQRQLICLARAIIRNNKILVLDEATANVDLQTDVLIQNTIRKKFSNCTVLTIAHRLNTVMDSDKVLVMDAGTMVEFDHPHKLLQNRDGIFYGMVEQTGKVTAENLKKIAKDSYAKLGVEK